MTSNKTTTGTLALLGDVLQLDTAVAAICSSGYHPARGGSGWVLNTRYSVGRNQALSSRTRSVCLERPENKLDRGLVSSMFLVS